MYFINIVEKNIETKVLNNLIYIMHTIVPNLNKYLSFMVRLFACKADYETCFIVYKIYNILNKYYGKLKIQPLTTNANS